MKIKTQSTRQPLVKGARVRPISGGGAKAGVTKKEKAARIRDWQAEEDAHTLARYQELIDDPKRKAAAIKRANEIAEDMSKRAEQMKKAGRIDND